MWRARGVRDLGALAVKMARYRVFVCGKHFTGHRTGSAYAQALVTGVVDAVARLRDVDAVLASQQLRRRSVTGSGTCLVNLLAVALHRAGVLCPNEAPTEVFDNPELLHVRRDLLGMLVDAAAVLALAVTQPDLYETQLVATVYGCDAWEVLRAALVSDGPDGDEDSLGQTISYLAAHRPSNAPVLDLARVRLTLTSDELGRHVADYFREGLALMRSTPGSSVREYYFGLVQALEGCSGPAGNKPRRHSATLAWTSSFYDVLIPVFRPVLVRHLAVLAWRRVDASAPTGGLGEAEFTGLAQHAVLSNVEVGELVRRSSITLLQIGHHNGEPRGLPSLHYEIVEPITSAAFSIEPMAVKV